MTRRQQIEEEGVNYAEEMVLQVDHNTDLPIFRRCKQLHFSGYDIEEAFDAGAQWADKTMIDKAVEWLAENAELYKTDYGIAYGNMIMDFRKAMEE